MPLAAIFDFFVEYCIKTCDVKIPLVLKRNQKNKVFFDPEKHLVFNLKEAKPAHSNAMEFTAFTKNGNILYTKSKFKRQEN